METIADLKRIIEGLSLSLAQKEKKIELLEEQQEQNQTRIEELEEELDFGDKNTLKICGEDVIIVTNNLQHQTFFEQFAEFSKQYKSLDHLWASMVNKL